MSAEVFDACCPGAENCSPIPSECSEDCKARYPDFYVACQEVIEGSGDVTNAEELASFLEVRGLAET